MARLYVSIPFFYDPTRLPFLFETLSGLESINQYQLSVKIFTNNSTLSEHGNFGKYFGTKEKELEIIFIKKMGHPYFLTWHALDGLLEMVIHANQEDLFMYLEDDIKFTKRNLSYWVNAMSTLTGTPFIPGLLRVEGGPVEDPEENYLTDHPQPYHLSNLKALKIKEDIFIQLPRHYQASFLVGREVILEYKFRGFNPDTNPTASGLGIRERAASSVNIFETPAGFSSRLLFPIQRNRGSLYINPDSLIGHLPANYKLNQKSKYGKLSFAKLFIQ